MEIDRFHPWLNHYIILLITSEKVWILQTIKVISHYTILSLSQVNDYKNSICSLSHVSTRLLHFSITNSIVEELLISVYQSSSLTPCLRKKNLRINTLSSYVIRQLRISKSRRKWCSRNSGTLGRALICKTIRSICSWALTISSLTQIKSFSSSKRNKLNKWSWRKMILIRGIRWRQRSSNYLRLSPSIQWIPKLWWKVVVLHSSKH